MLRLGGFEEKDSGLGSAGLSAVLHPRCLAWMGYEPAYASVISGPPDSCRRDVRPCRPGRVETASGLQITIVLKPVRSIRVLTTIIKQYSFN